MKSGIHPEYHEITVIMTDGTEYTTRSCYGKAGDTIRLDIDTKSHPAWTGVQRIMDTGARSPSSTSVLLELAPARKADFFSIAARFKPRPLEKGGGAFHVWCMTDAPTGSVGQTATGAALWGLTARQNLAERGGST